MKTKEIATVRGALAEGRLLSVEFHTGSQHSATFYVTHPDYGRGTKSSYLFSQEETAEILSGFRMAQHEFKTCY